MTVTLALWDDPPTVTGYILAHCRVAIERGHTYADRHLDCLRYIERTPTRHERCTCPCH